MQQTEPKNITFAVSARGEAGCRDIYNGLRVWDGHQGPRPQLRRAPRSHCEKGPGLRVSYIAAEHETEENGCNEDGCGEGEAGARASRGGARLAAGAGECKMCDRECWQCVMADTCM